LPEPDGALAVHALVSGYGKKQVLNGISLSVAGGEVVALIGHNGSGKSTLLKAVFGLLRIWKGEVTFYGKTGRQHQRELLADGIVYVPQGNCVLTELTVLENIALGFAILRDQKRIKDGTERALTMFPALKGRVKHRAATLSGGEKQMLALASAFALSPRLLLLDEPSLGLAPSLAGETLRHVESGCRELHTAALIVEQKVREVLKISQRVYVLRNGRVSFEGRSEELRADEGKLRSVYL